MGHSGYTHTDSRCSSVHLERGEINHTLQKDESPAAIAPSKQEREEGLEGAMGRKATAEFKDKRGGDGRGSTDLTKKCLKRFPLLMVGFVLRLQTAGGKLPHVQAEPAGVLENLKD